MSLEKFFDADLIVAKLQKRKLGMVDYLRLKIEEEDWHGVADAAMDIREIEAELKVWETFSGLLNANKS